MLDQVARKFDRVLAEFLALNNLLNLSIFESWNYEKLSKAVNAANCLGDKFLSLNINFV